MSTYKIEIPKILFLALDISCFYRHSFFNTNDLTILANRYKKELVRQRKDKIDYKYLEDTNFGGLRGNFSTLLTWRGLVKRGSRIVSSYSVGKDNKLVNAVYNGKIILDRSVLCAYTNDEKLKRILENEAWLLSVREKQAHVKIMLEKNPNIPLKRDYDNFPKVAVFKSDKKQYYIRALINNFADNSKKIIEYNLINLWQGKKYKKKNIHLLVIIPKKNNPWADIYALKSEDLYDNKPILLRINLDNKKCLDENGNSYEIYPLSVAIDEFTKENENVRNRLEYDWDKFKKQICDTKVDLKIKKEDEFSNFLREYLDWSKNFIIDGKEVVDIKIISSGGPDVQLVFSGGTTQMIELEHKWKNYLDHGHHHNHAFNNVWIYADEDIDEDRILKLYAKEKDKHGDRIPDVFLGLKDGKRKAYRVNWDSKNFKEIEVKFK